MFVPSAKSDFLFREAASLRVVNPDSGSEFVGGKFGATTTGSFTGLINSVAKYQLLSLADISALTVLLTRLESHGAGLPTGSVSCGSADGHQLLS